MRLRRQSYTTPRGTTCRRADPRKFPLKDLMPRRIFTVEIREAVIGSLRQSRAEIVAWVGCHIIPCEGLVRAKLLRQGVSREDVDDVVQDAYLAISRLDGVAHIEHPRAYFFTVVRNALLQRLRRERVVRIDSLSEALAVADDAPNPERQSTSRMELERVRRIIEALPPRCREIFVLRRIQGVPQREIALRLGVTEKVVEAQAIRGLKLIMNEIRNEDCELTDASERQARSRRSKDDAWQKR